jgi:hypothetical protein
MTYREKIQAMIETLQQVYADSDWMRDYADQSEKQYWNAFRGKMQGIVTPLSQLDRTLTTASAAKEVG